jgi:hypothetical protein
LVDAHLFEEWQDLLSTGQFENGLLHVNGCGIQADHLETGLVDCLPGVDRARVDQDRPTRRGEMFCAFAPQSCGVVGKGLQASSNHTDHVIIVAMARKGVIDVIRPQSPDVKLGMVPDFRPFFGLHLESRNTRKNELCWLVNLSFIDAYVVPYSIPGCLAEYCPP